MQSRNPELRSIHVPAGRAQVPVFMKHAVARQSELV